MTPDLENRIKNLRCMIFDVDGVLTDGKLYFDHQGNELKAFSSLDGLGMRLLADSGIHLAIITGRSSAIVSERAKQLGIEYLYQGVENKASAFQDLLHKLQLDATVTGYMGEDLIDLPIFSRCGVAFSVPTAPFYVREKAHYVAEAAAGFGAVREVCDLILNIQDKFEDILEHYWQPRSES